MSATNAAAAANLSLIFENVDWANIGDAAGLQNSATAGSFYISLHTASPGETGNQTTSEATYTGYARVAVARGTAQWTVTTADPANCSNDNAINFAECTGGSNTITHFGVGTDASGNGNLLFFGALTSSLAVSNGITPSFAAGELDINND